VVDAVPLRVVVHPHAVLVADRIRLVRVRDGHVEGMATTFPAPDDEPRRFDAALEPASLAGREDGPFDLGERDARAVLQRRHFAIDDVLDGVVRERGRREGQCRDGRERGAEVIPFTHGPTLCAPACTGNGRGANLRTASQPPPPPPPELPEGYRGRCHMPGKKKRRVTLAVVLAYLPV